MLTHGDVRQVARDLNMENVSEEIIRTIADNFDELAKDYDEGDPWTLVVEDELYNLVGE